MVHLDRLPVSIPTPFLRGTAKYLHRNDPAEQAYTEAVQLFQDTLSEDDRDRIWVRDKSSLKDVQNAVNNAKKVYLARSNENKAGKWLTKLAQRIMHYEKVMDTFANFHPEYCALAWGTMKFLLMVCWCFTIAMNHYIRVSDIQIPRQWSTTKNT